MKMSNNKKHIVTARSTVTNEQLFIECSNVSEALQTAGKLNRIELREHTYTQIRLRKTPCPKIYKRIHIEDII